MDNISYIKKLPNSFIDLSISYIMESQVVYLEYIKGSDKLNYQLEIPNRECKFCLNPTEETLITSELNLLDTSNAIKLRSFIQVDGEVIDLILFARVNPENKNIVLCAMINIGEVKGFRPNISVSQKQLAMGQLAMGMAHDMNNQLMILYGMISQIEDKGQISKELETIKHVVDNSTYMLKQITDFSRMDRGREIISVNDMLIESIEIFSHNMKKNIIIKEKYEARNDIILGKITMLQSVILNIAINARDAMPAGGEICISTYNIVDNESRKRIAIKITDNGEGIDKNVLPYIFDMFYTTKAPGKGTGLGLALAKTTIKEHGGRIKVESTKGEGTTFVIELLLASEEKDEEIPPLNYVLVSINATQRLLISNFVRSELNGDCYTFATILQACDFCIENDIECNILIINCDEEECANSNKDSINILKGLLKSRPQTKWIFINQNPNNKDIETMDTTKETIKNCIQEILHISKKT